MKTREQKRVEAEQRQVQHDSLTQNAKLMKAYERGHRLTRKFKRLASDMTQEQIDWCVACVDTRFDRYCRAMRNG